MTRPAVYAAHPVITYGRPHERACLAALRRKLPGVRLIDPAKRYWCAVDWLLDWPRLVRTLDGLVIFTDEDGIVGAGVVRETGDCLACRVPVVLLGDDGRLRELAALDLVTPATRTPQVAAYPVTGTLVDRSFLDAIRRGHRGATAFPPC